VTRVRFFGTVFSNWFLMFHPLILSCFEIRLHKFFYFVFYEVVSILLPESWIWQIDSDCVCSFFCHFLIGFRNLFLIFFLWGYLNLMIGSWAWQVNLGWLDLFFRFFLIEFYFSISLSNNSIFFFFFNFILSILGCLIIGLHNCF
jgi:hypothetical protein